MIVERWIKRGRIQKTAPVLTHKFPKKNGKSSQALSGPSDGKSIIREITPARFRFSWLKGRSNFTVGRGTWFWIPLPGSGQPGLQLKDYKESTVLIDANPSYFQQAQERIRAEQKKIESQKEAA